MKTRLVRIGNSRGIRIPKPMLEEAGLEDEVELEVSPDGIRITPTRTVREGWEAAAAQLMDDSARPSEEIEVVVETESVH